jgi:hypothetical protein
MKNSAATGGVTNPATQVVACGEFVSVPREGGRKTKCTCGRRAKDCPVWGPL